MTTEDFPDGTRVKVTQAYPSDRDYPIAHALDAELWGLVGTVIGHDKKYVFVEPLGIYNTWPKKEHFDPLARWHFLPDELAVLK